MDFKRTNPMKRKQANGHERKECPPEERRKRARKRRQLFHGFQTSFLFSYRYRPNKTRRREGDLKKWDSDVLEWRKEGREEERNEGVVVGRRKGIKKEARDGVRTRLITKNSKPRSSYMIYIQILGILYRDINIPGGRQCKPPYRK